MGPFSILRWHLAPPPPSYFSSFPCLWLRLRGGQTLGDPEWEGQAAWSQRDRPCRRQMTPTHPSLLLPPPLFLGPLLSLVGCIFPPLFPRKTGQAAPGKAVSPSPELVRAMKGAGSRTLPGLPGRRSGGKPWHPSPASVLGWEGRLARTGCSLGINGHTHTHTELHTTTSQS